MVPAIVRVVGAFAGPVIGGLAFWPALAWPKRPRAITLTAFSAGLLALPALVPLNNGIFRAFATLVAFVVVAKLYDLHVSGSSQPSLRELSRNLSNPSLLVWRLRTGEASEGRTRELRRMAEGGLLIALGASLGLPAVVAANTLGHQGFLIEHTVKLVAFFFCLEGALLTATATVRLMGGQSRVVLKSVYLACTPADFWRRYNRIVGQFAYEDLFRKIGGRRSPAVATLIIFALSGLAHEYLFSMAIGSVQGYQIAFFMIQGAAVVATLRLHPRGKAKFVGIGCTFVFNVLTSILFFKSVAQLLPIWSRAPF